MNITEEELKDLREARNGQEWNKLVDKIKAKRNGLFRLTGILKLY